VSVRRKCDPLSATQRLHWLTVCDLHRNLISCEALESGADLRVVLKRAVADLENEGWRAENDGSFGFVFIARGSDRRLLNLTPAHPAGCFGAGHAFLAGGGVVHETAATPARSAYL
jgi:hypothetical protein